MILREFGLGIGDRVSGEFGLGIGDRVSGEFGLRRLERWAVFEIASWKMDFLCFPEQFFGKFRRPVVKFVKNGRI